VTIAGDEEEKREELSVLWRCLIKEGNIYGSISAKSFMFPCPA
jgi:hypothetical protein